MIFDRILANLLKSFEIFHKFCRVAASNQRNLREIGQLASRHKILLDICKTLWLLEKTQASPWRVEHAESLSHRPKRGKFFCRKCCYLRRLYFEQQLFQRQLKISFSVEFSSTSFNIFSEVSYQNIHVFRPNARKFSEGL